MLLKKIMLLAAKVEATPGTAVALADPDGAFNAYQLAPTVTIPVEHREGPGGFDRLAGVPGTQAFSLSFRTDVEWDGTAALPDWAEVLLPACGYVKDGNTFKPKSAPPGSQGVTTLTMAEYCGPGKRKIGRGCVGTFNFVLPTGKMAYFDWQFQGVWVNDEDIAMLTPVFPSDDIFRFADASAQFGGLPMCLSQLTLDAGNEILLRECPGDTSGFESGVIVDRYGSVSGDPESVLVATDDRYGKWRSGTQGPLDVVMNGPNGANIHVIMPAAQIENIDDSDRGKLKTDGITFRPQKNGSVTDDSVRIIFNNA